MCIRDRCRDTIQTDIWIIQTIYGCIQINIHLLFTLYSDENIIFTLYTDNMHMVFRLFAILFANSTNLGSWSYGSSMHGFSPLHRGWCCPSFLFIHLPLQLIFFLFTSLLFHHLLSLVLFLFVIFLCFPCLLVISCCTKKQTKKNV